MDYATVPDIDILDRLRLHGGISEAPHSGEAKEREVKGPTVISEIHLPLASSMKLL